MTTKERLHRLIDALPEEEIGPLLESLAHNSSLVRAFILSDPHWREAIERGIKEEREGRLVSAKDFFASLD